MVNSRIKSIAKVLLVTDTESVERLFEQRVELPGGKRNLLCRWESLEREELSKRVCPGIAILLCRNSSGC